MNEKALATANAVMDEALANWKSGGVVVFEIGRTADGTICAFVDKPEMPKLIEALSDAKAFAPEEAQSDLTRLIEACQRADDNHWPTFPNPHSLKKVMVWASPAGWAFKIDMPGGLS